MVANEKRSGARLHENVALIQVDDRVSLDMILADAAAQKCLLTRPEPIPTLYGLPSCPTGPSVDGTGLQWYVEGLPDQ